MVERNIYTGLAPFSSLLVSSHKTTCPHHTLTGGWLACGSVQVSALALLKMAMHAKSGGNLEIMGMLQGKIQNNTFIVLDAFALPVEGTETRVNAQAEAYEYIVDFAETSQVTALSLMQHSTFSTAACLRS